MIHLYRSTHYKEWFSHSDYCYCKKPFDDIVFDKDITYKWIDTEEVPKLVKIKEIINEN